MLYSFQTHLHAAHVVLDLVQSMLCEPRAMRCERRPCAASFPLTPRERQFFAARSKFRRPSSDCDLAQSYKPGQSDWLYRRSITWLCFFPGRAFSLGMAPLRVRKNGGFAPEAPHEFTHVTVVAVALLTSPAIGLRLPKVGSAPRFVSIVGERLIQGNVSVRS